MSIFDGLNDKQQEAVRSVNGPLLILAGAGSGKTRTLVHRFAHIVESTGVHPGRILAMTFTNKAAGEMRERVDGLLKSQSRRLWVGTFHSLCARILRVSAEAAGLDRNFTIFDGDDQVALLRRVIRDQELDDKQFPPNAVRARISREKTQMVGPESFSQKASGFFDQQVARIYRQYQEALLRNNAVDFDDLLMRTVRVFQQRDDVLADYAQRFQYIMIDEYQDTNHPQYMLAKLLAASHRNLCVVGDDDQSIYGWRGADLNNILDFETDYPDARVIRLEQNYRSTQVILDAGNAVIANNQGRKGKKLWTESSGGDKIRVFTCRDEQEEASRIAGAIKDLRAGDRFRYREVAVLYRTNAQSRAIEEGLRRELIPYVIVGGLRFYQRKEIKDILGYLRVIANPVDSVSLLRILNTPKRGIGDTSARHLADFAAREAISPYAALGRLNEIPVIRAGARQAMIRFFRMMEDFREKRDGLSVDQLAADVLEASGYKDEIAALPPVEAETRQENVNELLAGLQGFCELAEDPTLEAFLEEVSLVADVDQWDDSSDAVTLMTLHSAKGLEFPAVVITGLEEGLLPILRPDSTGEFSEEDIEEERRLFYVGITRAQKRLFLSFATQRRRYGRPGNSARSRFVTEVPEPLLDIGFRISEQPEKGSQDRVPGVRRTPPDSPPRRLTPAEAGLSTKVVDRRPPAASEPPELPALELFSGSGSEPSLEVGSWVHHPTWGRGQIQQRSEGGGDLKLTIRFVEGSIKKVVAKYANLRPA